MQIAKKYILMICFLSTMVVLQAQETSLISKSEVLQKVALANQSIKIANETFNEAKGDYRQTNTVFLPNISVSHTGISTTNPLMAFGSKLNQEVLTPNDFNPELLNNPSQIQNFATRIEVQQPLINMDGFYQRKAAKSKMKAMELQTERLKDYVNFEVNNAYMQLQLAYKTLAVLEKALNAAEANLQLANQSFVQGLVQRQDVLAVEVRVTDAKNQLQMAKSQIKNSSQYLSYLINEDSHVVFKPSDSLMLETQAFESLDNVSAERADVKAMALVSEAYANINKADKMTFLPTVNAFGSYELYDDQIFQADANGYVIGAQLKWNILEGTKRFGKAQKSQATYNKSKLEYEQYKSQSTLELNKTKRALLDAKNKLELTALAMKQSEEALRIRTNRFREGLEKTSDLLMAETMYAQKQLEHFQTIYNYNYTQAYLYFLTLN